VLLVVFALVCAEFSDVDSGGRVPVRNAVIQRVRVDCREGKLPPGTAAGLVCAVVAIGHPTVMNSPSTTPRCCIVVVSEVRRRGVTSWSRRVLVPFGAAAVFSSSFARRLPPLRSRRVRRAARRLVGRCVGAGCGILLVGRRVSC